MDIKSIPGFTGEASLYKIRDRYLSVATQGYTTVEQRVVSQVRAGALGETAGPFSGSCGCWPGVCCCIFCYYDRCVFWCWSTALSAN